MEGRESGPTILVTGFEPFGGLASNPALEVLGELPGEVGCCAIATCAVPVEYGRAVGRVWDEVVRCRPAAVVMVGQARGRAAVTVERVAINVDDCASPDNAGEVRRDVSIRPDGPAAYFSTLPVKAMVEAMRARGVPADVSDTAGTYVCNHLMYGVLDRCAQEGGVDSWGPGRMGGAPVAGFVHVPLMHGQVIEQGCAGEPSMALGDIARALVAGIEALAERLTGAGAR